MANHAEPQDPKLETSIVDGFLFCLWHRVMGKRSSYSSNWLCNHSFFMAFLAAALMSFRSGLVSACFSNHLMNALPSAV